VWISFAEFEVSIPEDDEDVETGDAERISDAAKARGRAVFDRAYQRMKEQELKEEVWFLHQC
jgi:crooked neck